VALMPVVLEVAEECPDMDRAALAAALHTGAGRAEVMAHLGYAERGSVRGGPHVFTPDGHDRVNPGLEVGHRGDYPVVSGYDPQAYEEILQAA
jgi:hypothetical protein